MDLFVKREMPSTFVYNIQPYYQLCNLKSINTYNKYNIKYPFAVVKIQVNTSKFFRIGK